MRKPTTLKLSAMANQCFIKLINIQLSVGFSYRANTKI